MNPLDSSQVYATRRDLVLKVEEAPPLTLITLEGFLAQLEVYKLKRHVDELLQRGARGLLFDLNKVGFIDSAGIGALLQLHNECRKLGGHVAYVRPGLPQANQPIDAATLPLRMDLHTDRESALASLTKKFGMAATQPVARPPAPPPVAEMAPGEIARRLERIEQRLAEVERRLGAR
jgi:anti-anti-sigma factor